MRRYCVSLFLALLFASCSNSRQKEIVSLLGEWEQREILFPENLVFTIQGRDTVNFPFEKGIKIVSYVDSAGCTNCKLRLREWSGFITCLDSNSLPKVPVFFFLHPKDKADIEYILRSENFNYPVCIDINDSFNKLNHLPAKLQFQTFLLDKDNKVLAIGNPVHNPKVKELYLKIIRGERVEPESDKNVIKTEVNIDKTSVSLGSFDWQKEQKVTFTLKNIGNSPLVIENVNTSCGCISVSYSKEPVSAGKSINLEVTYKADHPEYFSKTITIYCNSESSPIKLTISGNAQ